MPTLEQHRCKMSILKENQQKYAPQFVPGVRMIHCNVCNRKTRHVYNMRGIVKRIYVCLSCGNERSAR